MERTRLIKPETWKDIAHECRLRWQQGKPDDPERWAVYEPWFHYGYDMAFDPRHEDRQWIDVEADLKTQYPEWMAQHGYRREQEEGLRERFRDSVREAWDSVRNRRHRGSTV